MDIEQELERTFKVPTALLSFLAVITGILVLFFPYILNILIAFFLVVWGLMKAFELGNKPRQESKTGQSSTARTTGIQTIRQLEENNTSTGFDESDSN